MNAGNSSSPYFTLTLPNEFVTYNVRVTAANSQGQAQSSVITVCPGQNREQGVQYIIIWYLYNIVLLHLHAVFVAFRIYVANNCNS